MFADTGANVCCQEANEISVLSAGAARGVVADLADSFRVQTGYNVKISFAPVGLIKERYLGGEHADVLILTAEIIQELGEQRYIEPDRAVEIGRVGVGVAVREGAPLPDISTADAFRQTVLSAKSLVYADPAHGASSGIHFTRIAGSLGITEAIKGKSILLPGGGYAVIEKVAAGEAELGIQQITEIVPVKGVRLVGPLPPELQKVTTYQAAIAAGSVKQALAAKFLELVGAVSSEKAAAAGFGRY